MPKRVANQLARLAVDAGVNTCMGEVPELLADHREVSVTSKIKADKVSQADGKNFGSPGISRCLRGIESSCWVQHMDAYAERLQHVRPPAGH